MRTPIQSDSFVDVGENRNSLEPRPASMPDDSCLHRQVAAAGSDNDFATQRGHPVFPVRLPSRGVSLSVGDLAPGASTATHRHAYESLIYVISGEGHTLMQGNPYPWRAGDALYVPPWCWHQHVAAAGSQVRYITATNLPMLLAMGQTVLREEART